MVVILFLLIFFKQILWTGFIPLWQFPDEQAHFAQVQNMVEENQIQGRKPTTSEEIYLSEKLLGTLRDDFGNNKFTYHPEYVIPSSNSLIGIYEEEIRNFSKESRKKLVINEATGYPPFYYAITGLFYKVVYNSGLFERVFLSRIGNIFIFLLIAFVTHKIGKLLFPKDLLLQITLTLLVTFQPMLSFVAGGINSDNLFSLLFTLGIYISLKIILEKITLKMILVMLVTLLLAILTKPQGRLLALVYLFPLLVASLKISNKKNILGVGLLVVCIGLGYSILMAVTGQQILPNIPTLQAVLDAKGTSIFDHLVFTIRHTYREVLPWYWGVFRWLSLTYPRFIHRTINILILFSAIGIVMAMVNVIRRKKVIISPWALGFLLYVSIIYFASITFFDFLFMKSHHFSIGVQGRYFFPTIVAHMTILLIGLATIFKKLRIIKYGMKAFGIAVVALQFYAWFFVSHSYFSLDSLQLFFVQASQYKPFFFKSPFLESYVIVTSILFAIFVWYYLRIKQHYETS